MDEALVFSLIDHFSDVEDPRLDRTKKHLVIDIIAITVMATISGMHNWIEIVDWATGNEKWLKTILKLPSGIPSHDTFGRVFSLIKPDSFQEAFSLWVESIKINFPSREIIALDGKTLRGSTFNKKDSLSTSVSIVSAWACKSGLTLAQISTHLKKNEGEKKTMEKIIDHIDIRGNIITIDANGATPSIISKIAEREGDCVIGLKNNQKIAYELSKKIFSNEEKKKSIKKIIKEDSGHGREEKRTYELLTLDNIKSDELKKEIEKFKAKWPSIISLGRVVSEVFKGKEYSFDERYFLTSLSDEKEFSESARAHWGVENSLHWQMDVTFREDYCRVRIGHASANLGLIRRLALNLLKNETQSKKSIRRKQLLCNFDKNYLLKILMGI